jgi:transposase
MRPYGTSQQLAQRREQALRLLQRGVGPTVVAQRLGVTPQTVCRWRRQAQAPARPARRLGRPPQLAARQQQRLLRALQRGAYAAGYADDYWTLERIAHVVWTLFGLRYRPSGMWYLLRRLGWSCQKPQRRSLARDEAAIAQWQQTQWPRIKKVA